MGDAIIRLRQLQQEVDRDYGNNNGRIDTGEEQTIFDFKANELIKNGELSVAEIFGADKSMVSEPIQNSSSNAAGEVKDKKKEKKEIESKENYIKTILKEEVDTAPAELMKRLKERLNLQANDPKYVELTQKVENILNEINKIGYNSKSDVEKLEKTVQKNLNLGKNDKFEKKVLKQLVKNAEHAQRYKEYQEIKKAYDEKVKAGIDEAVAYDAVRSEFKKKGSYYGDYLKHGNIFYKVLHFKRHYSEFENLTIMPDQRGVAYDAVTAQIVDKDDSDKGGAVGKTTSKEVKKDAKAKLVSDNDWNRYTKKALGGERNFGDKINQVPSDMQEHIDVVATINKTNEIIKNGVTEEEIKNAMSSDLLEALLSSGLVKVIGGDPKKYDVSELSATIKQYVGSDYTLNSQDKKHEQLAEKLNLKAILNVKTKLDGLSEKDAQKLAKLCGFRDKSGTTWNWGKALIGATIGALVTGVSAAASAATNKRPEYHRNMLIDEQKIHLDTTVNLNVIGLSKDEFELQYSDIMANENMQVTTIGSSVQIITDIVIPGATIPLNWLGSKHILSTALKSSLLGAALGLLNGIDKDAKVEIPVMGDDFECFETFEDFKKYIESKSSNPTLAEALSTYAYLMFDNDENGNMIFDCEQLRSDLKKWAGTDSVLNKTELRAGLELLKRDKAKEKKDDSNIDEDNINEEVITTNCTAVIDKKDDTVVVDEVPTLTNKQTKGWGPTISTFYPCLKDTYGLTKAIRMLKLAQGIRDNNYSKERMEELYNATYKKSKKEILALNIEGFDAKYYYEILVADDVPKRMFAPDKIGDCDRTNAESVGKVRVQKTAKTVKRPPETDFRGSERTVIGDTTINFCDKGEQVVDPNNINQVVADYEKEHSNDKEKVKVTIVDNRQ